MKQKPWLASYGAIPHQIDPDACPSLVTLFDKAMLEHAERPAFTCFGQTLTYRDVDQKSRALAAYLQSMLGVCKGDRVAVMLPNLMAFPIALIAIARIGAIQVNVNPLYTARELEHQLTDAGAETIIVFDGGARTVAEVIKRTGIRHVLFVGASEGGDLEGAVGLEAALAQGANLPLEAVPITGDDLIFLQYTGGTTGLSKGAALTHRNLIANVSQFKAVAPDNIVPGEEVVVTAIPPYHIFALTVNFITYFSIGAHNWLVPNPRDMDTFIDILKAARCTVFTGVNTLFAGLTLHPRIGEVDFSALRMAGGGGSAILPATSERWKALTGVFIREGYGLSETSPIVSFNPPTAEAFNGTTGLPLPSTDVRLLRDDGTEAALGEAGEVCVKGPQVMRGYWNKPEANAAAFTDDYFRTGDVGVLDEAGYLKIVDRKKDMIIVSGFNVYPNEVEAVISGCDGVAECACVGISDEKTGEAVKVYVVKVANAALDADTLVAYCRERLTPYKAPKSLNSSTLCPSRLSARYCAENCGTDWRQSPETDRLQWRHAYLTLRSV